MIDEGSASPKSLKGYLLLATAALTCPCHLPLVLALLAGTGLAGVLSQHVGIAVVALTIAFLATLHFGLKALKEKREGKS